MGTPCDHLVISRLYGLGEQRVSSNSRFDCLQLIRAALRAHLPGRPQVRTNECVPLVLRHDGRTRSCAGRHVGELVTAGAAPTSGRAAASVGRLQKLFEHVYQRPRS